MVANPSVIRLSFIYGRSTLSFDVLCVFFMPQREHNTVRRSATPATLRPMSWRRSEEVQDEDTAGYFLMLLTEAIAPAEGHTWHGQRRADLRRAVEVAGTLLGACSGVPVRAWRRIGMQVSPDSQPRHHWYLRSPILSAGQHSKQGDGPAPSRSRV